MVLRKDLVPGSRSDRLSFHSESLTVEESEERMEATSCPSRPTRGLTPKGAEPNRVEECNGKDAIGKKASSKNNWNSVERGERAKREEGGSCIYAAFVAISNWIWGKISGGGGGLVELMQDPFAMSRVVSKKGKINTHRDSQQRGLNV